jgi:hypothetical protein
VGEPQRWFQAVAVFRGVGGKVRTQQIHAKEFGTLTTACGIQSGSLLKEWGRAFQPDDMRACPECRDVSSTFPSTSVFVFATGESID